MKEIDYKLLETTVQFPLKIDDYGTYIWDKNENMIFDYIDYNRTKENTSKIKQLLIDKITGQLKELKSVLNETYILKNETEIFVKATDEYIGCIRGWGHFQYEYLKNDNKIYNPERGIIIQDNLANYILNCLNQ